MEIEERVMDIRRLRLWESRNATVLCNDLLRVVVEDQGGMVLELSSDTPAGGRMNAHLLPHYRGSGTSVFSDENAQYWKNIISFDFSPSTLLGKYLFINLLL